MAEGLPRPEVEIHAVVPYERGDLVDRIHRTGRIQDLTHTAEGTEVRAFVRPALADELSEFKHG